MLSTGTNVDCVFFDGLRLQLYWRIKRPSSLTRIVQCGFRLAGGALPEKQGPFVKFRFKFTFSSLIRSWKTVFLFPLLLCNLKYVQTNWYTLTWRSYSLIYTLRYLIIIIMQTLVKALNIQILVMYILSSVRLRLSPFSQNLSCKTWSCVLSTDPLLIS